ncbi:MAG TPA: hypothetical protein VF952_14265 [Chloroflexia bacterium]|jgi:hypothetical protein
MSFRGARGLVVASFNPACDTLLTMVALRVEDVEVYPLVTGRAYDGEVGERRGALKKGNKFESWLYANGARLLATVVAVEFGLRADNMQVEDLRKVRARRRQTLQEARLARTREILQRLANNLPVPDLLIQPAFAVSIAPGEYRVVYPDYAVLSRWEQMYVVGEIKAFITRDNKAPALSLKRTRRQAAVEVIALREEAARFGLEGRVDDRAACVFGTVKGLNPSAVYQERLDAEVSEVRTALRRLERTSALGLGTSQSVEELFQNLVGTRAFNFEEQCFSICALHTVCRARIASQPTVLGDEAADALGAEVDLPRLAELIRGATPLTPAESSFVSVVSDLIGLLGYGPETWAERVA